MLEHLKKYASLWLAGLVLLVALGLALTVCRIPQRIQVAPAAFQAEEEEFNIRKIVVVDSNRFDVTMDDGRRNLCTLTVLPTAESKKAIVELLHRSTEPKIRLVEKVEGVWKCRISVFTEGSRVDLAEWLTKNGLIYR